MEKYEHIMRVASPKVDLSLFSSIKDEKWDNSIVEKINGLSLYDRATYLCPIVLEEELAQIASNEIAFANGLPILKLDKDDGRKWLRQKMIELLDEDPRLRVELNKTGEKKEDWSNWIKEFHYVLPTKGTRAFISFFPTLRLNMYATEGIPALTTEQSNAISDINEEGDHHRLVAAPPGAGKTYMLVAWMEQLIREKNYKPEEIKVISFTTTAAREVLKRFNDRNSDIESPDICTADSFALRIVRSYNPTLLPSAMNEPNAWSNGRAVTSILKGDEKTDEIWTETVKRMINSQGFSGIKEKQFLENLPQAVTQCRTNLWEKGEVKTVVESMGLSEEEIQAGYTTYTKIKKERDVVDFIDIREMAIKTLEENQSCRTYVQNRCKALAVDEYQDTNLLQKKLERAMLHPKGIKLMVGDDDQSIFGRGMGGRSTMMIETSEEKGTTTRSLTASRRFKNPSIPSASNALAQSFLKRRIQKSIAPPINATINENLKLITCPNSSKTREERYDDEICVSLGLIASRISEGKTDIEKKAIASESAILCRTREQVARTKLIINTYPEYKELASYVALPSLNVKEVISSRNKFVQQSKWILEKLEKGQVLKENEQINNKLIVAYEKAKGFEKAGDAITAFMREYYGEVNENLTDLLQILDKLDIKVKEWSQFQLDTVTSSTAPTVDLDRSGFEITTIHKAKGLEWDNVYILGQGQEDDLAKRNTKSSKEIQDILNEEEVRVLYVALTRARKEVVITASGTSNTRLDSMSMYLDRYEATLDSTRLGKIDRYFIAKKSDEKDFWDKMLSRRRVKSGSSGDKEKEEKKIKKGRGIEL